VITAVGFDVATSEIVESLYSDEITGSPIFFADEVTDLVIRSQSDIVKRIILRILQQNPNIDLKPLTVVRDIFIDPPAQEFENLWILSDFIHRSQSFVTLMQLDDADGDGISDPVSENSYKERLSIALILTDSATQLLIDEQFDKLAGNYQTFRLGADFARGSITFYTDIIPDSTITIPSGAIVKTIGSSSGTQQDFLTLTTIEFDPSTIGGLYNQITGRYERSVPIKARIAGANGNVNANTITTAFGVNSQIGLTNPAATQFGTDRESNQSLTERASLAFAVDTGTANGYKRIALQVPGVQKVNVVKSGDDLMQRDYDEVRHKHIGGKVDIYVQGDNTQELQEKFVFSYSSIGNPLLNELGEPFKITSVSYPYRFEVKNDLNPIVDIDHPIEQVFQITNITRIGGVYGGIYDLTDVIVTLDGGTIELGLAASVQNTAIGLSANDLIKVSYSFREFDSLTLTLGQPVQSIISVTGDVTGLLEDTEYDLIKEEDPLLTGESSIAQDKLKFNFSQGRPVETLQEIKDESHVLTGLQKDLLFKLGIHNTSENPIVVTDRPIDDIGAVTYVENTHYNIVEIGQQTYIERLDSNTPIPDGSRVYVSYKCGENFTIIYDTNMIMRDVASIVENTRHATADVIVKQASNKVVDFTGTVVLKRNADKINTDRLVRTRVSRYMNGRSLGQNLNQSDIIGIIDTTPGVDKVIVPLLKMAIADGTLIYRESIESPDFDLYHNGGNFTVPVFKLKAPLLQYSTINTGGPKYRFKGIFLNELPLKMVDTRNEVKTGLGQGFISSDKSIYVSMFKSSDDPTINPSKFKFTVTYYVFNETGAYDITANQLEYISLGALNLIYDEL
jgi:hypothetical protein